MPLPHIIFLELASKFPRKRTALCTFDICMYKQFISYENGRKQRADKFVKIKILLSSVWCFRVALVMFHPTFPPCPSPIIHTHADK